jgi:hypothetical protein
VFLQNITGFMVGRKYEAGGIARERQADDRGVASFDCIRKSQTNSALLTGHPIPPEPIENTNVIRFWKYLRANRCTMEREHFETWESLILSAQISGAELQQLLRDNPEFADRYGERARSRRR